MHDSCSRRDVLKATGLALTGLALAPAAARAAAFIPPPRSAPGAAPKRALRLAHLTDIHVQPELRAGEGLRACLKHVQSLPDKPQLILTGGDLVFDTNAQSFARTKELWDLFTGSLKSECSVPLEHCIGNHDIWGWLKSKSGTTGYEKGWGKAWACEALGLAKPYRAFDKAGWHFVVLDTVFPDGEGYIGKLDTEQMEWLDAHLKAVPKTTPILVLTHIPILSMSAIVTGTRDDQLLGVNKSKCMTDAAKLHHMLVNHGNVKLCLSGHIHQLDRVDFEGITYLCDGAVCANWWKGVYGQCHEGYGTVDLYDDGTFKHEYVTYGWKAEPEGK